MSKRERAHITRIRLAAPKIIRERANANYDNRTVLQLERRQCRWPVTRSTAGTYPHLFCGRPTDEGGVYCEKHHGKAVDKRPPQSQRTRW